MRTRCIENRIFAITANRVGEETRGDLHYQYIGKSQVIDLKGKRLLSATKQESIAKAIDINPSESQDKFVTPGNHIFHDRRPELYRLS